MRKARHIATVSLTGGALCGAQSRSCITRWARSHSTRTVEAATRNADPSAVFVVQGASRGLGL
eukprot:SAG11_NODE_7704_length_1107_cov_1.929563_1_plen_62_part_10